MAQLQYVDNAGVMKRPEFKKSTFGFDPDPSQQVNEGGGSLGLSADEEHMASLKVPPEPQWFWCRVNQVSWWQMHSSSAAEREMDSLVGIPFIVSSVTFPSSSQLRI